MKKYITIIFLFTLFTQYSFTRGKGDQLLKSLQNKFNSIVNLTAEFSQSVNGKINLSGKFFFEKKNKLRLELKNLIIVSDGKTNWSYNKKDNKVVISDYDKENPSVFSISDFIESYPSQCSVSSIQEGGREILVLTAKSNSMKFKTAKIWINEENLIEKISINSSGGKAVEITFKGYQINQKLSSTIFKFIPPKGSSIVDIR